MMGSGAAIVKFSFWGRCYVKWITSIGTALTFYLHCFASSEIVEPVSAPTIAALFTFAHSVSFGFSLNFNLLFCDSRFLFFMMRSGAAPDGVFVRLYHKWVTSTGTAVTFYFHCFAIGFSVDPLSSLTIAALSTFAHSGVDRVDECKSE